MTSNYEMIDVGWKPVTRRQALARGNIRVSEKVFQAIIEKKLPKGDVLSLAEVAGIVAAKRTPDILPLCHPINLDLVRIKIELDHTERIISVRCQVVTHAKTGVEMEALSGVSAALLCIYDLTKSIDKGAIISSIMLEHKEGGKSGDWHHPEVSDHTATNFKKLQGLRGAVLTVSDRCSKGEMEDISGDLLETYLCDHGSSIELRSCVSDSQEEISEVLDTCSSRNVDLLVITGGTGIGPRDVTPEALQTHWTKKLPGFGELFRQRGALNTPYAWTSRAEAGLVGKMLVISLPGSPSAVKDGLDVIDQTIAHLISMVNGGKH